MLRKMLNSFFLLSCILTVCFSETKHSDPEKTVEQAIYGEPAVMLDALLEIDDLARKIERASERCYLVASDRGEESRIRIRAVTALHKLRVIKYNQKLFLLFKSETDVNVKSALALLLCETAESSVDADNLIFEFYQKMTNEESKIAIISHAKKLYELNKNETVINNLLINGLLSESYMIRLAAIASCWELKRVKTVPFLQLIEHIIKNDSHQGLRERAQKILDTPYGEDE